MPGWDWNKIENPKEGNMCYPADDDKLKPDPEAIPPDDRPVVDEEDEEDIEPRGHAWPPNTQ